MIGGLLSGFLQGFQAGDKMAAGWSDEKYKRQRSKYMEAQMKFLDQKTKDLQDPEMRAAKLRQMNTASDFRGELGETYKDNRRRRAIQDQGGVGGTAPEIGAPVQGPVTEAAPGPQSAIPTGAPTMAQNDEPLDEPNDSVGANQTQYGAKGGLVKRQAIKHFEDGGLVDEDDDEDDTLPDEASSTAGAQPYGGFSTQAAHDATLGGLNVIHAAAGSYRTAVNPSGGGRAVVAGKGAAGPMLTQQVLDRVDPKHEMGEGARNMAGLSAVYQYYMGKGQPKEATTAAAALLQQYRTNMAHYAALSAAALKAGHLDAAAAYAMKSYANVPDGRNLKLTNENGKLSYELTDEKTGKVQKKGIMSPQEFGASLTGFTPDQFEQQIASAAGVRTGKQPKGDKAPSGEKPADTEKRRDIVDAAAPDNPDDKMLPHVRSIADSLLHSNKLRPDDAVKMARMLTDPTQTPKRTEAKDGAYYNFKGSPRVFVPDDVIERITELRMAADKSPGGDVPAGQSRASDDPMSKADPEEPLTTAEAIPTDDPRRGTADRAVKEYEDRRKRQFTSGLGGRSAIPEAQERHPLNPRESLAPRASNEARPSESNYEE